MFMSDLQAMNGANGMDRLVDPLWDGWLKKFWIFFCVLWGLFFIFIIAQNF